MIVLREVQISNLSVVECSLTGRGRDYPETRSLRALTQTSLAGLAHPYFVRKHR